MMDDKTKFELALLNDHNRLTGDPGVAEHADARCYPVPSVSEVRLQPWSRGVFIPPPASCQAPARR